MPETSYASCGDLSVAYQVFGDGPVDLVFAGSFVSHVELFWTMPEFEAFMVNSQHGQLRRDGHRVHASTLGSEERRRKRIS